jgi:hypothetical protein
MTASVLLTGDATLPQLSVEFDKCERTILRWMDAPDGLPYVERMSPPRTETGAPWPGALAQTCRVDLIVAVTARNLTIQAAPKAA